jgi:hypothetical protein
MPRLLVMALTLALAAGCVEPEKKDHFLDFQWENRLLLIFMRPGAGSEAEAEMESRWAEFEADMEARDMLHFIIPPTGDRVRSSAKNAAEFDYDALRSRYNPAGERFTVIVIGKDSGIKYRREDRFDMPEIFTLIDGMPMRQRELNLKKRRPRL